MSLCLVHFGLTVLLDCIRNGLLLDMQAQQLTGVAVPSYYNPAAVNPLKYAEQLKKRKMLWSKAGKETADKEKEVAMNLHHTFTKHQIFEFECG